MPDHPEGLEEARAAARALLPACDVCKVEYVESYAGPCQEPLAPFDGSRTCPGKVALTPDRIAEASVEAAAPVIRNQERQRIREALLSEDMRREIGDIAANNGDAEDIAQLVLKLLTARLDTLEDSDA